MDILGGITTTNQVRAAMGITDLDLPDSDITSFEIDTDLTVELSEWIPDYSAIHTDTGHNLSGEDRDYIHLNLKLFCKYWSAHRLLVSAQNFILQRISDGDNEGHRFTNTSFKDLSNELLGLAEGYQAKIVEKRTNTTSTRISMFGVVTPDYDPVTNT